MRLLLDTNTLLWALTNSPRIVAVKGLLLANEAVAALEVTNTNPEANWCPGSGSMWIR